MQHYYAVAEPDDAGGFWISFPGRAGIASAAASAIEIVGQACDALGSLTMYPPADLPPLSIEDGAMPPSAADLADYDPRSIVVVIPFEAVAKAAGVSDRGDGDRQTTPDEQEAVDWWNSLSEVERAYWQEEAATAVPAVAWARFQRTWDSLFPGRRPN